MTEFTGIAYEPHPVSPERKAELRAQGLRIIDIQFQPATPHGGEDSPVVEITGDGTGEALPAVVETIVTEEQECAPAKRGRKAKAE